MNKLELNSLYQLTMARFRLFFARAGGDFLDLRLPGSVGDGAGNAFRNRPPDVLPVACNDNATDAGAPRRIRG